MAEREGFEPPIPFRVCRFSRPVPSTARPPLRLTLLGASESIAWGNMRQEEDWLHTGKVAAPVTPDRKSTRLNSSHRCISYAVFCLKKKINKSIYNSV